MKALALLAVSVVTAAAPAVAGPARVTQTSLAGVPLGLSANAYKRLLGRPSVALPLDYPSGKPTGWTRLIYGKRGISIYFAPNKRGAQVITTWDNRYKTAAGIGPCSLLIDAKIAYGKALKPSKFNTQKGHAYAYTLGKNLILAVNWDSYVHVVGLYDGNDPKVNKPGGSLSWAGYITLNERTCNRS